MNPQTINFRNDYSGNDFYKINLKDFIKKISNQSNNDYNILQDLKSQIVNDKQKNYYEFTGDGYEMSNIYFDIDIDSGIDEIRFKDLMKNEKYKDIETIIKTFIINKVNEMKNDNLNEMKFVDCRNHRITYGGKNKFSYRLFCYTHKLEKYKIKNLVKYLNKIVLENKDISKILPFNNDKMLDESIYDTNKKMSKLTLVTGLWNIKRDELGEGWSRPFQHYLDKFELLLKVESPMIIFGDSELESFVYERRSKENTTSF